MSFLSINTAIKLLLFFLLVINLSDALFTPLFAVFATGSIPGVRLTHIGMMIAIYSLAKAVVQMPVAAILDKKRGERDEYQAILLGALIGVIYPFGLMLSSSIIHLYVLAAINGVGGASLMAAYYALFAHHTDKKIEGFEWSLLSVFGLTLSTALGSLLGGIISDSFGFQTTLMAVGILNSCAILILVFFSPYIQKIRQAAVS